MLRQLNKVVLLFLVITLSPVIFNNSEAFAAKTVVINEVELNPLGSDYSGGEVVELYNAADSNVDVVVIDGGEPDKGSVVRSTIEKMNVTKIDAIVATHPHADHIGGLISVMDQMPVDHVYDSGQDYTTKTYFDYLDAIDRHKIPYTIVHDGSALSREGLFKRQVL
jgi:beta-lactamase superfamily II metal-dependent hydrolase